MKRGMLNLLVTVSIIFLSTTIFAQDFLVTQQGDTIRGEIKQLNFSADKKVQVTEPGKKKVIYSFLKVKSFSVDGDAFQPVKGPDGYVFMKVVKLGYLSLFSFQPENQTAYSGLYLLKKDGSGMEIPNLTFKKAMRRFLEDCTDVADKIENDVLNKKDLHQIVDEYNSCIENRAGGRRPVVAQKPALQPKTSEVWNDLENKVKSEPDFPEKANALEMIAEIKSKISASQKIPNFLIEGLKSALPQDAFKTELENALKEIN